MLEKSEKYQKLYYSFLNFIRENLELNKLVYGVYFSTKINSKVEKFMKENSITESILLGLIDELSLNGFIKYEEQKNIQMIIKEYSVTFKIFSNNVNDETIFFAREFDNNETKNIYIKIKNELEKKLNLKLIMLEDDKAAGNIHSRIKNEIKYCKYFIADLTYKIDSKERGFINGNVMFEIGMAKAYNKPCLLIMNSSVYPFVKDSENKNLPFDISSHTTIEYSNENDKYIESVLKCVTLEIKNKL